MRRVDCVCTYVCVGETEWSLSCVYVCVYVYMGSGPADGAALDSKTASVLYGGFAVLLGVGAVWSQVIVNTLVRVKTYIIE